MKLLLSGALILLSVCVYVNGNDVEVGTIKWQRDYERALVNSGKSGKPLFLLFQEVPGCSGCKKYGKTVLSHPLLVEAVENLFEPVLVYNNRSEKKDNELLAKFNEPAWNYQVVRYLDKAGKDIIPRKDKIWSVGATATRMIEVLKKQEREVPAYLEGVAQSNNNPHLKQVLFTMYCFWTGEQKLGALEGVLNTEAGFYNGREVTRVWYDSSQMNLIQLISKAHQFKCADEIHVPKADKVNLPKSRLSIFELKPDKYSKAPESDQKRQLTRDYKRLELTDYQRTKVNSWCRINESKAKTYLSPRQLAQLK